MYLKKTFACVLVTAISLTALTPTMAELVGAWSFNASEGDNVLDGSGNHQNGKIMGTPKYVSGVFGDALSFDGVENYVEIGGSTEEDPLSLKESSFTITFWIMPDSIDGVQRFVTKDNGENYEGGYSIYAEDGLLKMSTNDGKNHNINVGVLRPGVWRFVALVYDRKTGERRIYLNAELMSVDNIGKDGLSARSNEPLLFGGILKYDQRFSGALDEVRIYNEALSGTQIAELIENPEKDSNTK